MVEHNADSFRSSGFYDQVAEEIESDNLIPGLWTRAFAEADGDKNRAKAIYIKLRVAALASDERLASKEPLKARGPKKKGFGRWFLIVLFFFLAVMLVGEWVDNYQSINSKPAWIAQLGSGVEMEFVPIPAGSFLMGSNSGDEDEKPVHRVTISKPFWLAKTEVTQRQYKQVMGKNPSCFQRGLENPVEMVSWNDAVSFCKKLTEIERQAGRLLDKFEYVLPTEAQWEYVCRAGTKRTCARNLDSMAWYSSNSRGKTHPVGTKQANAWGLYDMHGNVYEWCLDDWHGSYDGALADGSRWGEGSGSLRVIRGGGWNRSASNCRSTLRYYWAPDNSRDCLGFRVCLIQR